MGLHELMAIGTAFVAWDKTPRVVNRRRFVLPFAIDRFDKITYDNFWIRHLDVLEVLKSERKSSALHDFLAYVRELDAQGRVIIVTDNPAYDVGWINFYLAMQRMMPLDYSYVGGSYTHRKHLDVRSLMLGLQMTSSVNRSRQRLVNYKPHLPDWDAEHVLHIFCKSLASENPRVMNFLCTFNKVR